MSVLDCIVLRKTISDAIAWSLCSDGLFSLRSFRCNLEDPSSDSSLDYNLIWIGICPTKIEMFLWQLLRGRVMVRQVLQNFGYGLAPHIRCPFCNVEEESIDHLFLICSWSWKL
ncbi:hypothetical protein Dsin_032270 [Dipteronia sinensis]|uniref:Reverse transcriptase zinc-binding domain-containing protein n=1 Tax=Dipteronia sinensis TaxID=43782 RepID=A0AAE0DT42_9ROSI|nr:hypothetical protein Dsin_032270 [Dipteronia sinensis]